VILNIIKLGLRKIGILKINTAKNGSAYRKYPFSEGGGV